MDNKRKKVQQINDHSVSLFVEQERQDGRPILSVLSSAFYLTDDSFYHGAAWLVAVG
jgi:hypothetical protein